MLVSEFEFCNGIQKLYRFPNGYGASIVRHRFSYGGNEGLWELAVIVWDGDRWKIIYDTSITSDVVGYLNWNEVEDILHKIEQLPERNEND